MTDWLDMATINKISDGYCPDCGYRGFVLGPRGGMSQNIECGNLDCRSRFNIASGLTHRLVMAQRIPRQDQGGADWGYDIQPTKRSESPQ